MNPSKREYKCTCSRQPVLGIYGINENGRLYFHQMVRKQSVIKGQSYTTEDISVWCYICGRWWHLLLSKNQRMESEEILTPRPLTGERGPSA